MIGLTKLQARVLQSAKVLTAAYGAFPSYREIMADTGIKSTQSISRTIWALSERGYLLPGGAKGYWQLAHPHEGYPFPSPGIVRFSPAGKVIEASRLRFIPMRNVLSWQQLRDRRATPQIVDVAA